MKKQTPVDRSNPSWLHAHGNTVLVDVLINPKASRTRIVDVHDKRLKIQIAAPPVEGKANHALVQFLAKTLGVSKAQIDIVGGASSRRKTVRVSDVGVQKILLTLSPYLG